MNKKVTMFFKMFIRYLSEILSIIFFHIIFLSPYGDISFWTIIIDVLYIVVAVNLVEWSRGE